MEGDRQPLQVRVQVGAHGGLDLVGGARDEQPPQQDQPGFECAERQHAEDEPGEGVELAARDRAVDDRAGDERDRQPREGGGERGDTAADQGGAVRADVGQQTTQLAQGWGGGRIACREGFAHGVENGKADGVAGASEFRPDRNRGRLVPMTLRIGYKASAEQFGPRELVEYAVRAEEVGLDSAVVSDHFLPWRHEGGHAPSAMAWITAVGERTSRIQLGTSVLTPTFRYNPAVLAQTWASLGLLYPGRVMLGVGTGEALNEIAVSGREWPEFKERFARLREAVRLMRELWTGEDVSFEGEYYRTVGATIYDKPEQPIPVYVAAGGPVVAKYAGRAGDGFICTSGKGMDLYTEKLMPAVAEGAQAAGRDPAEIDNLIEIKMSYDRDPDAALENCRFWAPLSLTAEQKHSVDSALEMERLADELPIEQVAKRWIVASDPDEAVAQIKPYVDAGLNHLVFHGPGHDQERFLTQFAEDVLPKLAGVLA